MIANEVYVRIGFQETKSKERNCSMCKHFWSWRDICEDELEDPDMGRCTLFSQDDLQVTFQNVCSHFYPKYKPRITDLEGRQCPDLGGTGHGDMSYSDADPGL